MALFAQRETRDNRQPTRYLHAMPLFTRTRDNWFLSNNATVCGDVRVGELSSFWFNAVARGDVAKIVIGRRVNVQDGAVLHCDSGVENVIEDDVTIGHRAIVHGSRVGEGSLVGMGAVLLGGTKIGRECLIAAGAVVPPGLVVPDRSLVVGVPGKVARPLGEKDLAYMRWLTTHYVELAERYTREDDVRPNGARLPA
jgi:carbonic anhydrase/acetyltransferase-like protein (isoleucine patch superfamily)